MDLGTVSSLREITRPKRLTNSRYADDRVLNDGTRTFVKTWRRPSTEEYSNDVFHTVSAGEENRLFLIAYKYYKDPSLWWVIALHNQIIHPFEVPAGTALRIPSLAVVFSDIIER